MWPQTQRTRTHVIITKKKQLKFDTFIENYLLAAYRGKRHRRICSVSFNDMVKLSIVLLWKIMRADDHAVLGLSPSRIHWTWILYCRMVLITWTDGKIEFTKLNTISIDSDQHIIYIFPLTHAEQSIRRYVIDQFDAFVSFWWRFFSTHILYRFLYKKPCNPRSIQKPKKGGGYPKVFLGGLPSNVTETDLRVFFGRYGKVMEVVIMYDQEKKKSRGFGFLSFEDDASVERVTSEHYINLNGKQVEIKKAEPRDGSR